MERSHLSDLMANVQRMHNDLERSGENDRRRLESQLQMLEGQTWVDFSWDPGRYPNCPLQSRPQESAKSRKGLRPPYLASEGNRGQGFPNPPRKISTFQNQNSPACNQPPPRSRSWARHVRHSSEPKPVGDILTNESRSSLDNCKATKRGWLSTREGLPPVPPLDHVRWMSP